MSTPSIPATGKAPAILDAAEELFGRHGFEGVSMNTLAQQVGISKANIFHHFKTKEELYMTVLYRARRRFVTQLVDLTSRQQNGEQQIEMLTHAYVKHMLDHEPLVRLIMRDLTEKRRSSKSLADRLFADNFTDLTEVVREGQARGELRADFNPGMAIVIISAVSILYLQAREFLEHLPDMRWTQSSDQLADALWDILWLGLAPRNET